MLLLCRLYQLAVTGSRLEAFSQVEQPHMCRILTLASQVTCTVFKDLSPWLAMQLQQSSGLCHSLLLCRHRQRKDS